MSRAWPDSFQCWSPAIAWSRIVARILIADRFDIAAADVCLTRQPPFVARAQSGIELGNYSLSRTAQAAAIALGPAQLRLGVDIEEYQRPRHAKQLAVVLHPRDGRRIRRSLRPGRQAARLWTLKGAIRPSPPPIAQTPAGNPDFGRTQRLGGLPAVR